MLFLFVEYFYSLLVTALFITRLDLVLFINLRHLKSARIHREEEKMKCGDGMALRLPSLSNYEAIVGSIPLAANSGYMNDSFQMSAQLVLWLSH